MWANTLDGCSSNSSIHLTSLICLRCSGNDIGGGYASRDVSYEPWGKVDQISVVFYWRL